MVSWLQSGSRCRTGPSRPVASDPTVSRCIDAPVADLTAALAAIHAARAAARGLAGALAGEHALDHRIQAAAALIMYVDATLVTP
jgi:hypothetical protein